jgi:predicted PurR-regulated permease PerM
MNDNYPPPAKRITLPKPNPATQAAHRREAARQIVLPFVFALILFISVGVWLVWAGVGTVERWAQIAMIFMLLLGFVLGLLLLILAIGVVYLITQVLRTIPPYARLAQDAITKIDQQVKAGADISVRPVIEVQKFIAMVDVLLGRRKN